MGDNDHEYILLVDDKNINDNGDKNTTTNTINTITITITIKKINILTKISQKKIFI